MKNGIIVTVSVPSDKKLDFERWFKTHVNDQDILSWCRNIRMALSGDKMYILYHSAKVGTAAQFPVLYGLYKKIQGSFRDLKVEELPGSDETVGSETEGRIAIEKMPIVMRNATLMV